MIVDDDNVKFLECVNFNWNILFMVEYDSSIKLVEL